MDDKQIKDKMFDRGMINVSLYIQVTKKKLSENSYKLYELH